jgi:hypothetical protein
MLLTSWLQSFKRRRITRHPASRRVQACQQALQSGCVAQLGRSAEELEDRTLLSATYESVLGESAGLSLTPNQEAMFSTPVSGSQLGMTSESNQPSGGTATASSSTEILYDTGFESSEGYSTTWAGNGWIDGQQGWS